MNVNGVGAAGYQAWQGTRKAENNAKGNFGANVKSTGNVVHIAPDALSIVPTTFPTTIGRRW